MDAARAVDIENGCRPAVDASSLYLSTREKGVSVEASRSAGSVVLRPLHNT